MFDRTSVFGGIGRVFGLREMDGAFTFCRRFCRATTDHVDHCNGDETACGDSRAMCGVGWHDRSNVSQRNLFKADRLARCDSSGHRRLFILSGDGSDPDCRENPLTEWKVENNMIKYIQPAPVSEADGMVSEMFKQIKRDFGLVGDLFVMHSLSPSLLAGVWAAFRETEMVGIVPRAIKEAVATAVAKANECPFCMDAHSTMLMAVGESDVAYQILGGQIGEISDRKLRSIVEWTLATRVPHSPILQEPPFTAKETPEIIGTLVMNNYITRMIDVLLTNKSLISVKNSFFSKLTKRLVALLFSSNLKKEKTIGDSLVFLRDAQLPDDLSWASSNPVISKALANLAAAVDQAGEADLDDATRSVIKQYVDEWNGAKPSVGRGWVEQVVKPLDAPSQAAARLCLLTAIAPYQIDDTLIDEFRAFFIEDRQLLNVLAWASFTVARKIGSHLTVPV
ncbi:alkylhydroperoxidase [Paenibacillus rigui]|uniref:Alkylhydroperoxidase n=2 Tax=Paenibacillus rigui TaxID=554312 RepID=A0A229UH07_9BACL|nr:alkylhydroperoxidase [Paenibacillus rigui]